MLLICLLSLIAAGEEFYLALQLYQESRRDAAGSGGVGDLLSRLGDLRALLPETGVIGYVSDGMRDGSFASADAMADYYDTQYALAPVIVVIGVGPPLVVANFAGSPRPLPPSQVPPGYRTVFDQGGGIMLLERAR